MAISGPSYLHAVVRSLMEMEDPTVSGIIAPYANTKAEWIRIRPEKVQLLHSLNVTSNVFVSFNFFVPPFL
jgi:hypothetical protein